ncbi:SprT-like family-domain-containing protein [Spinellus fusiger]|nr:SprT-like family-domain-containing protein [Spinellus fusiger]
MPHHYYFQIFVTVFENNNKDSPIFALSILSLPSTATGPMNDSSGDEAYARQLQREEEKQYIAQQTSNEKDTHLAQLLQDPCPDIHALFLIFNPMYFHSRLDPVEVKWSRRLTLCAGLCCYQPGGLCTIKLSEPLLKLRPAKDLLNTLLHEMIHAYLFITKGHNQHDGHGPDFLAMASDINKRAGTCITVYHNFKDEVDYYRQHHWQCQGPCQYRPPYFGLVKRSMNRPPQMADAWFSQHQQTCGGFYIKVAEPPQPKKKKAFHKGQKLISDDTPPQDNASKDSPMKEAAKRRKPFFP